MYDPALPAENSPLSSAEMRSQLTGLKALIDAIATLNAAEVDGVTTGGPGTQANVAVSVTGNTLHFTFEIPQGENGSPGDPGPPGEVSSLDLYDAIQGTSANSNGVLTLDTPFGDPDTEAVREKVNELINALRRNP